VEMDATHNLPQLQSSPASFYTVKEFQSPSSFLSESDFEGFTDDDNPGRQSSTTANAASPLENASLLTAPPTFNLDGSLRLFTSLEDALSYCQSWARDHGYAVRKCRSKSRPKEKTAYKVYIKCEYAEKKQAIKVSDQFRSRKD
jgi:hypothetical protein